jgi:hypothetical protein
MALADLMKKGFLTSATAIPATPATHGHAIRTPVASVATVAVAKIGKFRVQMPTVAKVAGVAVAKPEYQKSAINMECLAQFQIDDCLNDPELQLIDRINDMAWAFMEADGMGFDAAIALAAEITVHGTVAHCESSYVSVRELWQRMTANKSPLKEKNA